MAIKIKSCLKAVAVTFLSALLLAVAAAILAPRLLSTDTLKQQILSMTEHALNRKVTYQEVTFSWRLFPSVVFRGVTVAERSGTSPFIEARQLAFTFALLPLFNKEVYLREVEVDRPVVVVSRDHTGQFNIDDLLKGKNSGYQIHLKKIRIRNGQIRLNDRLQDPGGFSLLLENLDLQASGLAKGKTSTFQLSATIPGARGSTAVSVKGRARIPATGRALHESNFDLTLAANNLDLGRYWPYYGRFLPFKPLRGQLDLDGTCKGTPDQLAAKVKLRFRDLRLDYPQVFHAVQTPRDLRLAAEVELSSNRLAVNSVDLAVDGLRVTGNCLLGDLRSNDPRITAHAVTSPFRLEEFHQYIPFGIIPRNTSDFIARHIKGGTYRLDDGRLDGRVSQILHMERGENYQVLRIRGRVEKGLVDLGPGVPTFNDIRGNLDIRDKDFTLHGMTGNFGASPFTLDGKIADYLQPSRQYPFEMAITPATRDVAWMLGPAAAAASFSGRSLLRLSGSGTPADYRVGGAWELSSADYRYGNVIRKPAGLSNRLRFTAHLTDAEVRVEELQYEIPPLQVTADGSYRYHQREPLTFRAATNKFLVDPLLPLMPRLQKYRPAGAVQARISGAGNPARPDSIRPGGEITLSEFSVRPLEQMAPFSGVTGTINLAGAALETKKLTGRVGGSAFTVSGRVAGSSDPAADLVFSSPQLHLQDLGFRGEGPIPKVNDLAGSLSLKNGKATIGSLSGRVAHTSFAMSGEVTGGDKPKLSVTANFPYLKVEDLEPLIQLKFAGKHDAGAGRISLKARVTSPAGSLREIPFKELDTELALEGSRLAVQALRVGAFGGYVSGNGEADFAKESIATYRAHYRLDQIDAGQAMGAAGIKPHVTGALAAEGELTARGNTPDALRKTMQGNATVRLSGGQLIPSPSSAGGTASPIPYSQIAANLSWGDGTLTVQDLNAGIFSGTISGNGKVAFAVDGAPAYQARYRLHHLDSAQLTRAAGADGYLSGTLDAEGDFEATGTGWEEVRDSGRLVADVDVSNGAIRLASGETGRVAFKSLHSQLTLDGKVIGMKSVRVEAMGGVISGHGEADLGLADGPGYQVNCMLENVDAAQFLKVFRVTRELSGSLTMQAALTARGDSVTALEKTLQGSVHMRLDKGVINKYRVLARVFSILNVSQLLKLQLPDMEINGMAYNRIEVTFSLRDGIASTEDFTIDTPTLYMTAVGTTDLVREQVDLKIGVHPVQTVSGIISRIPVIGWILTGDSRRFLVVYFEAKGPWSDPKVSTLEMTALPRSVYNIFKRVFKLPDTLVTEPGKVIMGR